jgi:hypothetical protein
LGVLSLRWYYYFCLPLYHCLELILYNDNYLRITNMAICAQVHSFALG